jgi:hypothetical protein
MDKRFKHLGPIEHPDETGIYMDVLSQCIGDPDINNIAIAGPYAAGKSSIIAKYLNNKTEAGESENEEKRSFLSWLIKKVNKKKKSNKALTISIAAFQEDANKPSIGESVEDLQLRILQQILYTANGADLPQSRFNRIKNVKRSLVGPTLLTMWSLISYVLLSGTSILTIHMAWSYEFILLFMMVWAHTVMTIMGLEWLFHFLSSASFSKISLKNLEFEKKKDDETSFLSKYFDEILYFFDMHPYELVIFEDLDRFKSTAIFSKLRELNTLLNQNRGSKRKIQFIYALKDSMFVTSERTKFFDFILPVIPVTGTANSEDTFIERNGFLNKNLKVDKDLLRAIAQFVTDPRTINNTFNEYVIYKTAINSTNLDPTKLFALVLYKNIFIHDFDELHYGKGMLFEVLTQVDKFRTQTKEKIETAIADIEECIANAEQESAFSETELVNIYLGQLYRRNITVINNTDFINIETVQHLKQIIPLEEKRVAAIVGGRREDVSISFRSLEKEINPGQTIDHRLEATKNKAEIKLKHFSKKLSELRKELREIEISKLRDLCDYDDTVTKCIDEQFSAIEKTEKTPWQHIALVKYLVRKGFLDEEYSSYSTVFNDADHWTLRDQQLFLNIQSRQRADYNLPIDNPAELINRLSESEFNSSYIFNISLLDYLLNFSSSSMNVRKLLRAIKEHYSDEGVKFLRSYLSLGDNPKLLSKRLLIEWPEYLEIVFNASPVGIEAQWLVGKIDKADIEKSLSSNLLLVALQRQPDVFIRNDNDEDSDNAIELIIQFGLNVPSLETLRATPEAFSKILMAARFRLTLDNVFCALKQHGASDQGLVKQTYQEVINASNKALCERVDDDIESYIENVMFANAENTEEPERAILDIINNNNLSEEYREKVIIQQSHVFSSLKDVRGGHEFIFLHRKVRPSWQLLEEFYNFDAFETGTFVDYLSDSKVLDSLEQETIDNDRQNTESFDGFCNFTLNADNMENLPYVRLANCLIKKQLTQWPEVSDKKKAGLLEHKLIMLNSETYEAVADKPKLLAHLVVSNTQSYLNSRKELPSLTPQQISEILCISDDETLSANVAETLHDNEFDEYTADADILAEAYLLLKPGKTAKEFIEVLINYCSKDSNIGKLFDRLLVLVGTNEYTDVIIRVGHELSKSQIRNAISKHPDVIVRDLTEYKKRPGLPAHESNRLLLEMLKDRNILSQYSTEEGVYRVRKLRNWIDTLLS